MPDKGKHNCSLASRIMRSNLEPSENDKLTPFLKEVLHELSFASQDTLPPQPFWCLSMSLAFSTRNAKTHLKPPVSWPLEDSFTERGVLMSI